MTRNETIKIIRAALKRRSGKFWSVTGGRGTGYGWITINASPTRRTWKHELPEGMPNLPENWQGYDTTTPGGSMTPDDRAELASLLGLDRPVHIQGVSIPASPDYYQEYIDRAEGRMPTVYGHPYWD